MSYKPVPTPSPEQNSPRRLHRVHSEWLPYGLRRWYFLSLMSLVGGLEAALITTHSISEKNHGLDDDESKGHAVRITVAKLIPTILAVVLVFCMSIMFNDFKRTEPFARLASKTGASGDQSLTWLPGPWWEVIYTSLPLRAHDRRRINWPMLCTALVYVLGVLVISPFSSTLVVSQNVFITRNQQFSTLDLGPQMPIWTDPLPTTYFRTLSQAMYNVKTSVWITDKYAITPFWPVGLAAPLGPVLSQPDQIWKANTTVFSTNLSCEPLRQKASSGLNTASRTLLTSDGGCTVIVPDKSFLGSYDEQNVDTGGVTWVSSSRMPLDAVRVDDTIIRNGTVQSTRKNVEVSGCAGDEVIMFKAQSPRASSELSRAGLHCTADFFSGETLATVFIGKDSSHVEIDEEEYNLSRTRVSPAMFNVAAFQGTFLNANWSTYVSVPDSDHDKPDMFAYGPGSIVAAIHDFNATALAMVSSSSLENAMVRIKSHFLGETLRDVFDSAAKLQPRESQGRHIETRRRVVISSQVAFLLEAVLAFQFLLLVYIMVSTRSSRRPLGIKADPASPMNLAKLITMDKNNLGVLGRTANNRFDVKRSLSHKRFQIKGGQIYRNSGDSDLDTEEDGVHVGEKKRSIPNSRKMFPIKSEPQSAFWFPMILGFVILLVTILTTVSALYAYATTIGLYQKAFIYTMDVSISGVAMQINPASIVTTLVALCIGLWWGLLDTTHRKIQPFLAMAEGATPMKKGLAISYESSYLLWATYRALIRKHWILALVSTGGFLCQVLTISMASLWTQEMGSVSIATTVPWPLELRSVPQLYPVTLPFTSHAGNPQQDILVSLLGIGKTSWVYEGTAQVALNGSDPTWASDGWAFVPIGASDLTNIMEHGERDDSSSPQHSFSNITMHTQGIRARLQCSSLGNFQEEDDAESWVTKWDLRNTSQWVFNSSSGANRPSTGYQLGSKNETARTVVPVLQIEPNSPSGARTSYTDFFAGHKILSCCENVTDGQINPASVGYWSWNNLENDIYPNYGGPWPANFTIKWIRGRPVEGYSRIWDMGYPSSVPFNSSCLIWVEKPSMTALSCRPVVETSDASVTVNSKGRVLEYTLLGGDPSPDPHAWTDIFRYYKQNDRDWSWSANTTASYGALFFYTALGVGDPGMMTYNSGDPFPYDDSHAAERFAIKQPGLSADYMSYAMLGAVGNDHDALLDPETLSAAAGKVFSSLFQHFATTTTNNISTETTGGGNVFQRHGEQLPDDIGEPYDLKRSGSRGSRMIKIPTRNSDHQEEEEASPPRVIKNVTLSRPAEKLSINPVAAWLSIIILAYLIVICVVLAVASRRYSNLLLRRIETIADVAILMAGSPKLLDLARRRILSEEGEGEGEKEQMMDNDDDDDDKKYARLGWFYDEDGEERWGVEMVDEGEEGGDDNGEEEEEKGRSEQQHQQQQADNKDHTGHGSAEEEEVDSLILSNAWRPVREEMS